MLHIHDTTTRAQAVRGDASAVARRYPGHTICITENGRWQDLRPRLVRTWWTACCGCAKWVDVQDLPYPIVDMPDWHTGEWMKFGLWDVVPDGKVLRRVTYEPMLEEVRGRSAG